MYYIAKGTLLSALWWTKWEGNPKKEGIYVYSWYVLLCSRNQHNIVKQLYSIKINKIYTPKNLFRHKSLKYTSLKININP